MQWPDDAIAQLDDIVAQLAGETRLAQPDSDEGLLPILSLVGALGSDLPQDTVIESIIETMEATLHPLIEEARFFDAESIETLRMATESLSSRLSEIKSPRKAHRKKSAFNIFDSFDDLPSSSGEPQDNNPVPEPEAPPLERPAEELSGTGLDPETTCLTSDEIIRLESLAQSFSGELLLADVGNDEGLLPVFSILGEIRSEFEAVPFIQTSLEPVIAKIDGLLETDGLFDEAAIKLLTDFNLWLETARSNAQTGEIPAAFQPDESDTDAAAPENTISADSVGDNDLLVQFAENDVVLDLNLEENRELLSEFQVEATEHLGQIETAVLELEQDSTNREAIDSMFRSFHTIKGVAGFLNLVPVNRLAHEIESLMDLVRSDQLTLFKGIIDLVLGSADTIGRQIEQISEALSRGTLPEDVIPVSILMAHARWAMEGPEHFAEKTGTAQEKRSDSTGNESPPKEKAPPTQSPKKNAAENASIRVQTSKLDDLLDAVGELVIVQSQLQESAQSDPNAFRRDLAQLTRITKELQRDSMGLRLVPVKSTFQKMSRIVRDISAQMGKQVAFEISGEETELDRNVVEEIGDPLVHMIRNALDHGLESTAERIVAGKSETGQISLKAYHRGGSVVIELSDDGGGIDPERVFQKAVANGIVPEDESLPEAEIYKLIFAPGFSTAEEITDISGRGVGMDVVRQNIEKLRGKIEIDSALGEGSTFRIILPLTMAIIDGLIVTVGSDRFIIPTASVKVALRPDPESLTTIQGNQEILNLREKVFPLVRLHQHFQIANAETDPLNATLVIVETGAQPYALLVDKLVTKQEVVVKSLGSLMSRIPGVSGGAILGDGNIALILDPTTLVNPATL